MKNVCGKRSSSISIEKNTTYLEQQLLWWPICLALSTITLVLMIYSKYRECRSLYGSVVIGFGNFTPFLVTRTIFSVFPQSQHQDTFATNLLPIWFQCVPRSWLEGVMLLEHEAKTNNFTSKMATGISQSELFFQLQMAAESGWRQPFSRHPTAKCHSGYRGVWSFSEMPPRHIVDHGPGLFY